MAQLTSIWETTAARGAHPPIYPSLQGSTSCNVVVIGGGITGLTAAYLLGRAGVKVILVEAHRLAAGTTGRSTGNLYCHTGTPLHEMVNSYGLAVTKEVVQSRTAAVDRIEKIIHDESLRCDFQRVPFHYFLENISAAGSRFLTRELIAAKKCGLAAEILPHSPLPFPVQATLRIPHQAQFHPVRYARGLAAAMPKTVRLYEHSPALDIQGEKGIVTTAHGKIQADHIIMATGTPKGVFPVQLLLTPLREFALAVQVHDHAMPPGIFWGVGQEELSLRLLTIDAATSYLILIGEAHKTGHSPPHADPLGALHHYLAARFKISASGQGWSAQSYMAADNLPYIGHSKGRIFYMTGFSTDGLVYGTLAAMVVSDQILGNKNPWSTRYQVARCSLFKSAPAVVKEGLDICSHYLKNVLPSASTSLQEIAPGDGAIVQIKGERLAVYRKDASTYQCVSAVCTHLKCVVVFNPLEKTWDCPCHASRFATDGTVIEGPALKNLEIREG